MAILDISKCSRVLKWHQADSEHVDFKEIHCVVCTVFGLSIRLHSPCSPARCNLVGSSMYTHNLDRVEDPPSEMLPCGTIWYST